MVLDGEIQHGVLIADKAEAVWNWASPAGRQRAKRRAQLIIAAAALRRETRVLELGCGTGLFTRNFAETGCRVVAIDISEPLLKRAAANPVDRDVSFRLDDAEQLSFEDESFDAVIGSSVLHHLNVPRALAEAHRVLKPRGRLVFAEPNMVNPQVALQRSVPLFRRWAGESPQETAFVRWRLASQLRSVGFTDVRIEPFDFLHPAVPRLLIGLVRSLGDALERLPGVREIAGSLLISAVRDGVSEPSASVSAGTALRRDHS